MSFQMFMTVLIVGFGGWLIITTFRRRALERRLRENPPDKAMLEVRLPRDMDDSLRRMVRFYHKLGQVVQTDHQLRRAGGGVVSVVWFAEIPEGRSSPEIRCIIYCPPEHLKLIKRNLSVVFSGIADISTPKTDPLAEAAAVVRAQENPPDPDEAPPGDANTAGAAA